MTEHPESLCQCTFDEHSWGRSGWHFCILTTYIAGRWAANKYPHNAEARKEFEELLKPHIGRLEVAYERCPAYRAAKEKAKEEAA